MSSLNLLSAAQLLALAADPWSYWYPNANDDLFALLGRAAFAGAPLVAKFCLLMGFGL